MVDRLGRVSDHQRFLLRTLRDNRHRASAPLFKTFRAQQQQQQKAPSGTGASDEEEEKETDVETPLYYCRCIVGARPATLYITYSHLVFISRLPGFNWSRTLAFRDVRAASLSSLRLGFKLAEAIDIEVPSSSSAGAAASSGSSSRQRKNESVVFSSTTEPERLIELIKLLVAIHAEDAERGGRDSDGSISINF